jgi:DNA gyrase subunit A
LIAINLRDGDTLLGAMLTAADDTVMLVTADGQSIRFKASQVRDMGRTATGVKGNGLGQRQIPLLDLELFLQV